MEEFDIKFSVFTANQAKVYKQIQWSEEYERMQQREGKQTTKGKQEKGLGGVNFNQFVAKAYTEGFQAENEEFEEIPEINEVKVREKRIRLTRNPPSAAVSEIEAITKAFPPRRNKKNEIVRLSYEEFIIISNQVVNKNKEDTNTLFTALVKPEISKTLQIDMSNSEITKYLGYAENYYKEDLFFKDMVENVLNFVKNKDITPVVRWTEGGKLKIAALAAKVANELGEENPNKLRFLEAIYNHLPKDGVPNGKEQDCIKLSVRQIENVLTLLATRGEKKGELKEHINVISKHLFPKVHLTKVVFDESDSNEEVQSIKRVKEIAQIKKLLRDSIHNRNIIRRYTSLSKFPIAPESKSTETEEDLAGEELAREKLAREESAREELAREELEREEKKSNFNSRKR